MSSPSPAKSRWSRMGGVVRRASSVLAVTTRPSTPSIASSDHDADTTSLKGSGSIRGVPTSLTALAPEPANAHHAPSPIAESPAREAAATQDNHIPAGPSPLAQGSVVPEVGVTPEVTQTSPVQDYTPPPLLDSHTAGLGPGAFTDEPDELPQSQVIRDPSIQLPESNDGHGSTTDIHSNNQEPPVLASGQVPEPFVPEPSTPPPELGSTRSYFDIPVQEEPVEDPEFSTTRPDAIDSFKEVVEANMNIKPDPEPAVETAPVPQEETRELIEQVQVQAPPEMPIPAHEETRELVEQVQVHPPPEMPIPVHEETRELVEQVQVRPSPEMPTPAPEVSSLPPTAPTVYVPAMPTYDMNSGQEVWGGVSHKDLGEPVANGEASPKMSRVPSIRMPMEDPFADPIAPRITISNVEHHEMPQPESHQQASDSSNHTPQTAVIMPLPALHDVVPSRTINDYASTQSIQDGNRGHFETDETLPLLSRPGSPGKNLSYLQLANQNHVTVSPQSGTNSSPWPARSPAQGPRLHDFGWIEYQLPDGTVYYVHPTRRVTTDIDLRSDMKLDWITGYFANHKDSAGAPAGMEMWLRESNSKGNSKNKRSSVQPPIRCWIDHRKRSVVVDLANQPNRSSSRGRQSDGDDQLDMEYRYWSFVEAHPAHSSLPSNAKAEAMDVLTWAWTDRLLPSHRTVPAPFTQEECQELMSLLRSFGDQGDSGLQAVVQARIVSRILLRIARWRQLHFRPNKPLPADVNSHEIGVPTPHRPFRRVMLDFVISCICLGIPYMFYERAQHRGMDEESGLRGSSPMLVIGACTCIIAAIVLSASVTFLSLPGLDSIARIAGFVAAIFATFSMASTLAAIFRYKADLERPVSHVGGEGLMMLSRRSVIMSLPLVFLVYAIIGFLTGIVLYSFRGVTTADPLVAVHRFDDYTRWTVVGVLGGLAGILTTSLLLIRR